MKVILIQPPLVQLNSPYPAAAYLAAFFRKMNCQVTVHDFSTGLFYKLFSRTGLEKLFRLSQKKALTMAQNAAAQGDDSTAYNLRRYVSTAKNWIEWIDVITGILQGKQREKEHQFLYSPNAPRGNRMDNFLSGLDHEPTVDDVRFLCSYALADLADYITAVFDSNFSLIRYAEALTVDESSFSQIEKQIDSPVLTNFYEELLSETEFDFAGDEKVLVGISVPFAGTFTPALYTARFFKQKFASRAYVVLGGGFVNTELREADDLALSKYADAISYDRGYGGFYEFLKAQQAAVNTGGSTVIPAGITTEATALQEKPLYKFRQFKNGKIIPPEWNGSKETIDFENRMTVENIPDYSDFDFSVYPRLCDDKNPMQRMWSDGAWIKAYLAHGCYWHRCAFCDTQLDYVCNYKMTDIHAVFNGLKETAAAKKVHGIHFVDEALPPAALKKFALLNSRSQAGLYYWGNVRFEKAFSYDLAAFLSYGGLGGVSAGFEVATGEGLQNINKGIDIDSVVSACAAFKEAGILVHAYMIYGFWNDTAQNIINSMETLRQFFAAGLLDSAFWHKFMLTKNSAVMAEWEKGLHPELKPVFSKEKSIFAKNCLHFEGENKFAKYGSALDNALNSWMHGQKLDTNVRKWFSFEVPSPTVPKNLVEAAIEKYENRKTAPVTDLKNKDIFWLGSTPVKISEKQISWFYLQEEFYSRDFKDESSGLFLSALLCDLTPAADETRHATAVSLVLSNQNLQKQLLQLRTKGLVILQK